MSNNINTSFDWIPFYGELANKLLFWRNRQEDLIKFLEGLRAQGLSITPLEDQDATGNSLLTEIDPFTFFGVFNRAIATETRIKILEKIKLEFGVISEVPKNFAGIPILNNLNSWFIAFKTDRKSEDVASLWTIFEEALKPSPLTSENFERAFDNALKVKYTSAINLTFGLFWIRPSIFLNLDKNIRELIGVTIPNNFSFKTYLSILQTTREKHSDFAQLSEMAYLTNKLPVVSIASSKVPDSLESVINKCGTLKSKMGLKSIAASPTLEFSNTGGKSFVITLRALLQTLIDIKDNVEEFKKCSQYDETLWRTLCARYLKDRATNALSTVQSLPLFITISKLIHTTNELPSNQYSDGKIEFSADYINKTIEYLQSEIPSEELLAKLKNTPQKKSISCGVNRIYYGAPGTGKSYSIDQDIDPNKSIRIVFHADTQYSDFAGCLKPTTTSEGIQYLFRPGPFVLALINAIRDPESHFWLIIEEINRAPAAAVFGEIFQLLDRDDTGNSKYKITPSDPDMLAYIESQLDTQLEKGQIYIPSNLSLLATMNSSDQAVMPLDTAFKRRWKFRYIPLEFGSCAKGSLRLKTPDRGDVDIPWGTFAQIINSILSDLEIPEDRHLGPYFLNSHELVDFDSQNESLTGKLFMYLWDDVLRHGYRAELFRSDIKTYGQLTDLYLRNAQVFSDRLYLAIESAISSLTVEPNLNPKISSS